MYRLLAGKRHPIAVCLQGYGGDRAFRQDGHRAVVPDMHSFDVVAPTLQSIDRAEELSRHLCLAEGWASHLDAIPSVAFGFRNYIGVRGGRRRAASTFVGFDRDPAEPRQLPRAVIFDQISPLQPAELPVHVRSWKPWLVDKFTGGVRSFREAVQDKRFLENPALTGW